MFRLRHLIFPLAVLATFSQAHSVQIAYLLNVGLQCNNGVTVPGYSVYAVGGRPELGSWDPAKAVRLSPSAYPSWTGTAQFNGANIGEVVEWKCIIRSESNPGDVQKWQPDPNNRVTLVFSPEPKSVGAF